MTPSYVTAICKNKPNPRLLIIKLDTERKKEKPTEYNESKYLYIWNFSNNSN